MMSRRYFAICCATVAVLGMVPAVEAAPIDLKTAIERALAAEAGYRAARAERDAVREEIPRARAGLLPQLSVSGTRTENEADIAQTDALGRTSRFDREYTSENYAITLRQPLFRRDAWVRHDQAQTRANYAEQQLIVERDELVLRVGEAYLNGLLAEGSRQLARTEVEALEGLTASVKRGFSAGVTTRTDVFDAEARLDAAKVREIEAAHAIARARRTLESAVGESVDGLYALDEQNLLAGGAEFGHTELRETVLAGNSELAAARLAVELAEKEVRLQQAGHFPTVDLIAQRQKAASDTVTAIGSTYFTNLWGVQVNIPLFSGGYVTASTRQAAARLVRAQAELDAATERILLRLGQGLESLEAARQRMLALAQAERSATAALEGSEKGVRAGTRTVVDILNARQQLFEARQARVRAAAEYVYNLLSVKATTGQLDDEALERINRYFRTEQNVTLG